MWNTTIKPQWRSMSHSEMQHLDPFVVIQQYSFLKAHANGRNIAGQQHAALLDPTCCVRLHGTTTMLALVGTRCEQFEPFTLLGPCKRTQHCWPKPPNNTQQCCDLLCPFAWALQARSQDFSWGVVEPAC